MTKNEIRKLLMNGVAFSDILPMKTGQECTIMKTEWPDNPAENMNEVIYLPDISLNDDDVYVDRKDLTPKEVDDLLTDCYTVRDFIKEGYGNETVAHDLFNFCDWQHPNVQDLMDFTRDGEAVSDYGETWEAMASREDGIMKTRKELYRLYQLDWMMSHGYSVYDIIKECNNELYEFVADGTTLEDDPNPELDFENSGFEGSLWVCFDEFLHAEYLDEKYMAELMDHSPANADGTLPLMTFYLLDINGTKKEDTAWIISTL